ncbi:hypothetical protein NQ317_008798 [Molorchus minor]|uniref:Chitin-binding type-2 domain-containing protein n=1 Tax=Molorchus minor TaxID=1323400 RepID=A0ABQ9J5A2_9CUCU|nr:hypothetical protein NQ317_008798 [Molorchus minor]
MLESCILQIQRTSIFVLLQVYHHCLFGTRYDFLCANYTAFDQKTFICHFASEVDCANSKKFWHRNDALYKATPTTTVKPLINHNIYTPPPSSLISQASSGTSSAVPQDPVPEKPPVTALRRPIGGRRRPFRRRRPQYDYYEDYYDDYYEERPRSNRGRQRPRPRPRPLYDDDYDDDYEEDRYEKRGAGRRNEHRRPYGRRGSAKRRNKDDYDDEEDDRYDDFKSSKSSRYICSKRKLNDRPIPDVESEERYPDNRKKNRRRPLNERNENDNKSRGNQKKAKWPKKNEQRRSRPKEETKTIVKPVSGTIYDRPRVAPRIKPPVPKNQANKYSYKNIASTRAPVEEDEEYYDDYEDEVLPKGKANVRTPVEDTRSSKVKPKITTLTKNPDDEEYYDEYEEYEDELAGKKDVVPISSTTTTTSTEMPIENIKQPLVRLVKRPFLPSRGGNPFASRGLQPVGAKALEKIQNEEVKEVDEVPSTVKEAIKEAPQQVIPEMESDEFKPAFKPSPIIIKLPMNPKLTSISSDTFRSQSSTVNAADPKTTEKPKLLSNKNPLDVIEEDYDVTFNDALNPTLPNVPVREPPTEFSSNSDYVAANNFQRPKYVLEPVVSQTGVDYVYQNPLQSAARGRPVSSDRDYNGQYSTIREIYKPRRVQQRTEALYSRY